MDAFASLHELACVVTRTSPAPHRTKVLPSHTSVHSEHQAATSDGEKKSTLEYLPGVDIYLYFIWLMSPETELPWRLMNLIGWPIGAAWHSCLVMCLTLVWCKRRIRTLCGPWGVSGRQFLFPCASGHELWDFLHTLANGCGYCTALLYFFIR